MSEDKVRSVFEIDYTRWILTTLLGILLCLTPEICAYFKIQLVTFKKILFEYSGFGLVVFAVSFLIGYPNLIINNCSKNKLKKQRDINCRLRERLKKELTYNKSVLIRRLESAQMQQSKE